MFSQCIWFGFIQVEFIFLTVEPDLLIIWFDDEMTSTLVWVWFFNYLIHILKDEIGRSVLCSWYSWCRRDKQRYRHRFIKLSYLNFSNFEKSSIKENLISSYSFLLLLSYSVCSSPHNILSTLQNQKFYNQVPDLTFLEEFSYRYPDMFSEILVAKFLRRGKIFEIKDTVTTKSFTFVW